MAPPPSPTPSSIPAPPPLPPRVAPRLSLSRRLLFSALVLLGAVGIAELGCSFLPKERLDTRSLRIRAQTMNDNLIANNDVPGWDLRPDGGEVAHIAYTTNRWRMRGPDYEAVHPSDVSRVLMVGDSSIFGAKLQWEETFSAQFVELRAQGKTEEKIQVGNCAAPGHSTWQSKIKLKRHCLAFEPDLVVIGNQNSDSAFDVAADRDRFPPNRYPGLYDLLDRSYLYRALGTILVRAKDDAPLKSNTDAGPEGGTQIAQVGGPTGTIVRVPLDEYRQNLMEMITLIRESGAIPVLLVLPDLADVSDQPRSSGSNLLAYKDTLRELAATESLRLIDAAEWFRLMHRGEDLFLDVVHPNAQGAALLAELLDRQLPSPIPSRNASP
jgi:lysophospholipase L1-like esterase